MKVLTDSFGHVLSQGSAFLLDADDSTSFDFPAGPRGDTATTGMAPPAERSAE